MKIIQSPKQRPKSEPAACEVVLQKLKVFCFFKNSYVIQTNFKYSVNRVFIYLFLIYQQPVSQQTLAEVERQGGPRRVAAEPPLVGEHCDVTGDSPKKPELAGALEEDTRVEEGRQQN